MLRYFRRPTGQSPEELRAIRTQQQREYENSLRRQDELLKHGAAVRRDEREHGSGQRALRALASVMVFDSSRCVYTVDPRAIASIPPTGWY